MERQRSWRGAGEGDALSWQCSLAPRRKDAKEISRALGLCPLREDSWTTDGSLPCASGGCGWVGGSRTWRSSLLESLVLHSLQAQEVYLTSPVASDDDADISRGGARAKDTVAAERGRGNACLQVPASENVGSWSGDGSSPALRSSCVRLPRNIPAERTVPGWHHSEVRPTHRSHPNPAVANPQDCRGFPGRSPMTRETDGERRYA
jgi:hypothetical protein